MATRGCESCGATVDVDEAVLATTCAFCDSALVNSDAAREPVDLVAPFEVSRDRAGALLRGFLQGRWLAPESVRTASRPEELRSVLIPFWVYDATARTSFSATVGIHWYRTETYTTYENGKLVTRTRQVKETDWHPFSGTHARRWTDHLVSASRGLVEGESNALEPFDLGRALPFAPALVAGQTAERPTVDRAQAEATARQELAQREADAIAGGHLPGDTHRDLHSSTDAAVDRVRLALLPVWIAAVRGPTGPIRLLVNGQTGEVVGSIPTSWTKVGCLVVAGLSAVGLVVAVALLISGLAAVVAQ